MREVRHVRDWLLRNNNNGGDRLFFGSVYRIGNSCIAVARRCMTVCTRVYTPDFNGHASDISGDGNVRTLFITERFCSSRDNFGGYRDNIAAAIHYAGEYRAGPILPDVQRRN